MRSGKKTVPVLLFILISPLFACDKLVQDIIDIVDEKMSPIPNPVSLTILYDNYRYVHRTRTNWGFSCLVEGAEKTILFDTGYRPEVLWHNINFMEKDVHGIDIIVLSHNHSDHVGGLMSILEKNANVTVYIPSAFPQEFFNDVEKTGARVVKVTGPAIICNGVYTTGQMGQDIPEQGMVLDTIRGLVLISGCSHPGIVEMLEQAMAITEKDVYLSLGGYHLLRHSNKEAAKIVQKFKNLGVSKCGATHCTGDHVIDMFKEAYGDDYIDMGTGRTIHID